MNHERFFSYHQKKKKKETDDENIFAFNVSTFSRLNKNETRDESHRVDDDGILIVR